MPAFCVLRPRLLFTPETKTTYAKLCVFLAAGRARPRPANTARGGGSDTSGAAIGSGILLVFTAHMNKILELDQKKQFVTVEPGVTYDKLEQTLHTHGLFLPPYPASMHYATIGGGMANNAIGEKSVKYGPTSNYVERLRVVLANGELIETGPLSKRELNKKLGHVYFRGRNLPRTGCAAGRKRQNLLKQGAGAH
jgi:FAD/FMN-containing dehydrogenase